MEIIPVIDIRNGIAVRAVAGNRARYRPLETPLSATADPVAVALGYSTLFHFRTLYAADLDGIEGRGANALLQARLAEAWSGSELWIDDGMIAHPQTSVRRRSGPTRAAEKPLGDEDARPRLGPPLATHQSRRVADPGLRRDDVGEGGTLIHVVGSESLSSVRHMSDAMQESACILSLDFRGDEFIGPPELIENATLWPDRIIVMTLARVGTGQGPDTRRLAAIARHAGPRRVYAAGGVRHLDDLAALRDVGAAGALIATALHDGKIKAGDLEKIAAREPDR